MISCRQFAVLLLDYVGKELADDQRQQVDDHLCHCPPCATYLASYSVICSIPSQLPQHPVPDSLLDRVRAALIQVRSHPGCSSP